MSVNIILLVSYNDFKKSILTEGCKFSLYALKFADISNCNRVPSNRTILKLRSDQSETEHQQAVCRGKRKCDTLH
jgi:hypothetical protein